MTKDNLLPTQPVTCENAHCEETATRCVHASHLDPDDDGTGRMIGWSKPVFSYLCDECLEEWEDDELVHIHERVWL